VKSNKRQKKNKINSTEQLVQNKTNNLQRKESETAQKDGFRYDYNDNI
jgi:hypothetical protein